MSKKNRTYLKEQFKNGKIPSQEDFHDLIDSALIQEEDGLKSGPKGFHIQASREGGLFSFSRNNKNNSAPAWRLAINAKNQGLEFSHGSQEVPTLHLANSGKVGIGLRDPLHHLDVAGTVGMKGRMGYYKFGKVNADGNWHNLVEDLNAFCAFEVIAIASKKGAHAMTHATCVSTFGGSEGGINTTQNYFGKPGNKIELRWYGDAFNYALQARTKADYGNGVYIQFNLMKIWDDGSEG